MRKMTLNGVVMMMLQENTFIYLFPCIIIIMTPFEVIIMYVQLNWVVSLLLLPLSTRKSPQLAYQIPLINFVPLEGSGRRSFTGNTVT